MAKIESFLAATSPLREGATDWRLFAHGFWGIMEGSWSIYRLARRPAFRGYLRLRIPQLRPNF